MTAPSRTSQPLQELAVRLARVARTAALTVPPDEIETWAATLGVSEYLAWRLPGDEISVMVVGRAGECHVRVTAVFQSMPRFMKATTARSLPKFDSPAPAARLAFATKVPAVDRRGRA